MTGREWREASDLRPSRTTLACIVIVAIVLRFWALGHGIPFSIGVDEPEVLERAVNMMKSGMLNPHFFDYPALYIYIQFATACARFLAGAMAGTFGGLGQATPDDFYLWGRAVTAVFGAATVLLVFQVGMRWGARYALLAAGLMAVLPSHVRLSHYVLTDVPLTFFVTLTLLQSLRAHEQGTARAFAWAGAAVGLAAATKYNGALAIVMPLLTCLMTRDARPSRAVCALAVMAAGAAAFLVGAPYSLLDLPAFLNGFARLANAYHTAAAPAEPAWLLYLKHLRLAFGWPAMALLAAGLALAVTRIIRGPGRVRWTLVTIFPVLYFMFISDQRLVFGRYLLPLTPMVCVLVAVAVISGVSLLRRYEIPRAPRTALIAGLTIAALLPPALQAVQFDRMIARRSTIDLAHDWIAANIPHGARIAVETRALLLSPEAYRATNVPRLIEDPATRAPRRYADYAADGYQYFVASSQRYGPAFDQPGRLPAEYAAYRALFDAAIELVRLSPSDRRPGPEIRIYAIRPPQVPGGVDGSGDSKAR